MLARIVCAAIGLSFVVIFNPRRSPTRTATPAPTERSSLEAGSAGGRFDESYLHSTHARVISNRCAPAAGSHRDIHRELIS